MNNLPDLAQFGLPLALTIGLVEVIKRIDIDQKLNRLYPVFSLVIGGVLSILIGLDWVAGLVVGLGASGLYRGFKVVFNQE